ncbi:hypothetical protein GF406_07520 [candidate division KSB1 bacterium]|nr:hypothetical protein [candidate division KSB1 bacterium]
MNDYTLFTRMEMAKNQNLYKIVVVVLLVFAAWMQFYGMDTIVLGSDELYRARTLLGPDWSLHHFVWPEDAQRTYFSNWPMHTPVLFGLLTRAAVIMFGENHFALRFWPSLFAILSTAAIFFLFRSVYNRGWAWLTIVLSGMIADKMLVNAKALKHYTADIFFCSLILLFAYRIWQYNQKRDWVLFTLVSGTGIWLAFGTLFTAASAFAVLFFVLIWRQKTGTQLAGAWRNFFVSAGVFGLSLAGLYFASIQQAVSNDSFLTHISRSGTQLFDWSRWHEISYVGYYLARLAYQAVKLPVYFFNDSWIWGMAVNVLIAWAIYIHIKQKKWPLLGFYFLPMLLPLAASFVGNFPFTANRLLLYMLPAYVVLSVYGIRDVFGRLRPDRKMIKLAVAMLLFIPIGLTGYDNMMQVCHLKYAGGRHVDELAHTLVDSAQDGDTVYLHWGAILPFWVYATDHPAGYPKQIDLDGKGNLYVIYGHELADDMAAYERHFGELAHIEGRLWVAFGHLYPTEEMKRLKTILQTERRLLQTMDFKGCQLLLYSQVNTEVN